MQDRLGNDEFFTRLADLLAETKEHGSVVITQKRLTFDPSNPPPQQPPRSTKTKPKYTKNTLPTASLTTDDLSDINALLSSTIYSPTTTSPTSPTSTAITTPDPEPELPTYQVLIRATNAKSNDKRHKGKKVKIATVVDGDPAVLEGFFGKLGEVCKSGLTGLKKRDKKKKKKKEKQKAKKQKKAVGGE